MERQPPSFTVPMSTGRRCGESLRRSVAMVALLLSLGSPLLAQSPVTFRYFYDDARQLQKVVDSTGVVIEYVYDAVGNILEVRRSATAPGSLSIFSFTPGQGAPLTTVTIRGQGFASTPTGNTVRFNGVVATVTSSTVDTLLAVVPADAASGPISVTVGPATATSSPVFVVLAVPVITSIAPKVIDAAAPPSSVQISGVQLGGSTFAFLPAFQPPVVTVGTSSVNPGGTSATLPVTVAATARGQFTLVGTNLAGTSDGLPSSGNTIRVISGPDEIDTDGDGFPDRLEALLGSDPFDAASVPNANAIRIGDVEARSVSVLNTGGTAPGQPTTLEADAVVFSTLNLAGVTGGQPIQLEASAVPFSALNTDPSAPPGGATGGSTGGGGGSATQVVFEADAVFFSVNNLAPSAPPAAIRAAIDPLLEAPPNATQQRGNVASTLESQPLAFLEAFLTAVPRNSSFEVRNSDAPRRKP
jgi:YD repeat-containing protein